jgi:arabinogalactan endo-1,4-beta-galactosidase
MNKILKKIIGLWACAIIGITAAAQVVGTPYIASPASGFYAKGADISAVTQMEASGYLFYNKSGVQEDCFQLMSDIGFNSIRLRVWVNPTEASTGDSYSYCNTSDMVAKALRAKALGLKVMVDFHYSDGWAGAGETPTQTKPAAWANLSTTALIDTVGAYTTEVLTTLKNSGVTPDWVQVGNETGYGMLFPTGELPDSAQNYAKLNNAGYDAVKAVFPNAKVIVHVGDAQNLNLYTSMFDSLTKYGGKWDVIGMSYYPAWNSATMMTAPVTTSLWQTANTACMTTINGVISRYGSDVMICEIGMPTIDTAVCNPFLTDIIQKTKAVPNHKVLGLFYWEPEAYAKNGVQWSNWGAIYSAFNSSGEPTQALDPFAN